MTSAVQDRLRLNQMSLDKWTTREQLCLASAVSCSGDQNWMTVSRTLKLVCGNGPPPTRPNDWFSQKNCALQYGYMLENVETQKRKRRSSDSGSVGVGSSNSSGISSPATVIETPTDTILRRLHEDRIQELKAEIRREQEEFAQIYRELKALQSGAFTEEQMREMWCSIEQQQEQERVEEMKLENQMREREQQKLEMQRNWRSFATGPVPNTAALSSTTQTSAVEAAHGAADTTAVDMDVEEIIQTTSLPLAVNSQQQQQTVQPATSPLLTSLLKPSAPSGSSSNNSPAIISTSANTALVTSSTNVSARSAAPTITTLLTSGYVPNKNQPALTLKAGVPPQKAAQLLTSPISGPPTLTSLLPFTNISTQNSLSPSQAAPTLSMLLEKNKVPTTLVGAVTEEIRNDALTANAIESGMPEELDNTRKVVVCDTNNEEVPMDLDDDIATVANNSNVNTLNVNDSDDPDPNEEQQLLEVFKNIGNIDELDIDVAAVIDDEEVDFLKDMGAESPSEEVNVAEGFDKESADMRGELLIEVSESLGNAAGDTNKQATEENLEGAPKTTTEVKRPCDVVKEVEQKTEVVVDNKPAKVETISSDESNDNIPLAAVASLEQKATLDKVVHEDTSESVSIEKDDVAIVEAPDLSQHKNTLDDSDDQEHDKLEQQLADLVGATESDIAKNFDGNVGGEEDEGKSPNGSVNSDVIVIPTDDDDSCGDKARQGNDKSNIDADAAKIKQDLEADIDSLEFPKETTELTVGDTEETAEVDDADHHQPDTSARITNPTTTISIADTDDESSNTTEVSVVGTRKDEKSLANSITIHKYNAPHARKALHDSTTTKQEIQNKTDDESTMQFPSSPSPSLMPVRPPSLRKLRDRDRSESPLIEGDVHSASANAILSSGENTSGQRSRRRYSSTPINDSVPNSPSSSDRDRDDSSERRISKKSLLSIFHTLQYSKNAAALQRAFHDEVKLDEICLRPIDMLSIRKSIEVGIVRNAMELQRDIMLMCQNGLMLFKHNSNGFNAANALMQECQAIREFVANTPYRSSSRTSSTEQSSHGNKDNNKDACKSLNVSGMSTKSRSSSRKSQRIS